MTVSDSSEQSYTSAQIRAGLVLKGTSLRAWCLDNDVHPQNAHKAINGEWQGPKATALLHKIYTAAGLQK